MTDEARRLGTRWFEEVWNKKRREAIGEMFAPDGVLHEGGRDTVGPKGFYESYERLNATFSEIYVTLEDTIVEGDRACLRWKCSCKHTGEALGIPPTQKTVHITGITIVRAANGQLVEAWQNWDMLGMMEQIQEAPRSAAYVNNQ